MIEEKYQLEMKEKEKMKKERKRFPRQEGDEKKYRREHGVKNLKLPGPKHPKSIPKESRGG